MEEIVSRVSSCVLKWAVSATGSVAVIRCEPVMSCFFQAEDGIRDLVRSRGLGDVYKRQILTYSILSVDLEFE